MKMNSAGVGWVGVQWIGLAQDMDKSRALVNSVMNFLVLQNAMDLSSGYIIDGLSSNAELHRVS
jgi:hypothetical protein